MNKQELIEKYKKKYSGESMSFLAAVLLNEILRDLEQLDETKPVKVPQFVAEIIEYYKGQNATLYDAFREKNFNKQYNEWLMNEQAAYNKFARAWLDGYEVEKEKRYLVKIKGTEQYLEKTGSAIRFSSLFKSAFTRNDIEDLDFGWVFDCPGIEIEEVE